MKNKSKLEKLLTFWKDPVLSKLIAEGLKGFLTWTWPIISVYILSLFKNQSFLETFLFLYNYQISLGHVFIFLVIIFVTKFIFKSLRNKKTKEEIAEGILKKHNFHIDLKKGYKYLWQVHFINDIPKCYDLRCYCNLHEIPLILDENLSCIKKGCPNSEKSLDYSKTEILINSSIEEKYNDLIK